MKRKKSVLPLIALIVALCSVSFAQVSSATAKKAVLTTHELKLLLKTAKEPAEHRQIAEYYRQEAQRLTAQAKEHAELAEIYAKRQPFASMEAKHGDTLPGASHCRKWARLIGEQAKEAEALAVLHEDMATAAEKKD